MSIYRELVSSYNDDKRKKDLILVRYLYRPLSFPLTIPFIKLGITANQGTFINFIFLILASIFICTGELIFTYIGASFYLFIFILDCVDGNIARYHNQKSYFGKLTDGFVDTLVYFIFIFMAIGNDISGTNIYAAEIEFLAASLITMSMLTISYFRAKLALVMSEIKTNVVSSQEEESSPNKRYSLLKIGLDLIQNIGVLAPILYFISINMGIVSNFILTLSVIYVIFTIAEIVISLVKYSNKLNVVRS